MSSVPSVSYIRIAEAIDTLVDLSSEGITGLDETVNALERLLKDSR